MSAPLFRYLMVSRGMTQEQLRVELRFGRSYFSELLNGHKRSTKFNARLSKFFDLPAGELLAQREVTYQFEKRSLRVRLTKCKAVASENGADHAAT